MTTWETTKAKAPSSHHPRGHISREAAVASTSRPAVSQSRPLPRGMGWVSWGSSA